MYLVERVESRSSFFEVFFLAFRNRELLFELVKRELNEQFMGGVLGAIWIVFHPLFLIAVYIFVFGFVFKNKIGGSYELPLDYTTYILSGLIPWLNLQQVLAKSCSAITSNAGLVKQVIFPIELLPIKSMLATVPNQLISMAALLIYVLFRYHAVPWSYLALPLLMVFQIMMSIGLSFMLSATTTFVRDIKEVVNVFSFAGMFLLPIVYLPAWVPNAFKPLVYCNPFSYMIWCYQDVFYFGRMEHPIAWVVFALLSLGTLSFGLYVFRSLKTHFGDVL